MCSLVGWFSVDSNLLECGCLLAIIVCADTNCSFLKVKDEFFRELSRLLRIVCLADFVVVAGVSNAQLSYLTDTEGHTRNRIHNSTNCTDNRDPHTRVLSINGAR